MQESFQDGKLLESGIDYSKIYIFKTSNLEGCFEKIQRNRPNRKKVKLQIFKPLFLFDKSFEELLLISGEFFEGNAEINSGPRGIEGKKME